MQIFTIHCSGMRLIKETHIHTEWIWNNTYQKLQKQANSFSTKDVSMKSYNENEQLYLETDMFSVR